MQQGVLVNIGWAISVAIAAHIRCHRAEARLTESAELVAPRIPGFGEAVTHEDQRSRAMLDTMHANTIGLDRAMSHLSHHDLPSEDIYPVAATARTRSARSESRKTLRSFTRACTSTISLWTSGSRAASRVSAIANSRVRSKSDGRCPRVSGNEKSGTAATAHGVSISADAPTKKVGAPFARSRASLCSPARSATSVNGRAYWPNSLN